MRMLVILASVLHIRKLTNNPPAPISTFPFVVLLRQVSLTNCIYTPVYMNAGLAPNEARKRSLDDDGRRINPQPTRVVYVI